MRLGSLILGVSLLLPGYALACDDAPKWGPADRAWIKSDAVIYGALRDGRIFKASFGSNRLDILADHRLESTDFNVSPDGRYFEYGGFLKGTHDQKFFLYDTVTHQDRELPEFDGEPFAPYSLDVFSPDSSTLLGDVESDPDHLLLMKASDLSVQRIPYPGTVPAAKHFFMARDWSKDGKSLYVATWTPDIQRYYIYDLTTGTYSALQGVAEDGNWWMQDGKRLPLFDGGCFTFHCFYDDLESPDGAHHASIDAKTHDLDLVTKGQKSRILEKGEYSFCEGQSTRLATWLGTRYLAYTVHWVPYIYDVVTEKKSVLFDPAQVEYFYW